MIKYSLIIISLLFSSLLYAEDSAISTEVVKDTKAGEEIFNTICADACHQAPDRSRLRPRQWRVVLNTMQTRMKSAGRVPLNEEQTKLLLVYLSQEN